MKTLLLIEDNVEMRENTAEILELAGYRVLTAANGKEGVELTLREQADLVICDIMMPVLDGYGVLHLLSKNEKTAGIPFIFLTAKAERSDFRKGMDLGADDYLTKPFDDLDLLNAVERRLRKSDLVRQEFTRNAEGLNEFIRNSRGLSELKKLSESNDVRRYKKKESIYMEGGYPRGIFFINSGKIKTFRTHDLGKELITGLLGPGDFFGYRALMEETAYAESAEALEDSEVCFIPQSDFFPLLYNSPEVSRKFMHLLSNNLAEKEEELVQLAYNSVRKRVADALVKLHKRYNTEPGTTFSISITREDLANLAGTATETTIRMLSDFKEEGLITISSGTITLENYPKLAAMRN